MKKTIELFRRICKKSFTPIAKTSVSEWADNYRILSSESSAEPGRWRTDRAPYQREIMDSFTQPGIHKVVAKTASQIGKSDIMNNVMGRFAHLDPGPKIQREDTKGRFILFPSIEIDRVDYDSCHNFHSNICRLIRWKRRGQMNCFSEKQTPCPHVFPVEKMKNRSYLERRRCVMQMQEQKFHFSVCKNML